ncbi:YgaP-like transmembrane domain [Thermosulfuriphilus sp.]
MTPLRAQRLFMGTLLLVSLLLIHNGYSWGEYIIWFMTFMLYFSGITGFCPSDVVFKKIFGGELKL